MNIALFGTSFHPLELPLLFLLVALVVWDILKRGFALRYHPRTWQSIFVIGIAGFLCAILLSSLHAYSTELVFKSFFKWIEIFAIVALLFYVTDSPGRFKFFYYYFVFACLFPILQVIYSIFAGSYSLFDYRIFPGYESALLFALVLPLLLRQFSMTLAALVSLSFLGTVLSLSRAAWLALGIIAGYSYYTFESKIRKKIVLLLVFVLITGFSIPQVRLLVGYKIGSFFQDQNLSNNVRTNLLKRSWQAFEEHPLVGVGALNFPQYIIQEGLLSGLYARDYSKLTPHNFFLELLAETGLAGLLTFLLLLFSIIRLTFSRFNPVLQKEFLKPYLTGLRLALLVMIVNLLFGYIASQFRFFFAILLGLLMAGYRVMDREESNG